MKATILILSTLFNLTVYAEAENIKHIDVKSRIMEDFSIDSKQVTQSFEIEPTSIYQTTVSKDHQGKLKHKCDKTHKHPVKTISENK